jgi:hypothetical protein
MPQIIISLCEKVFSWAFHVIMICFLTATWNLAWKMNYPKEEAHVMLDFMIKQVFYCLFEMRHKDIVLYKSDQMFIKDYFGLVEVFQVN